MDRLTETGQPNPEIIGLTTTDDPCSDICDRMDGNCDRGCPINEAYRRLAAYEDTGHTPEELAGLVKKKKAGLLVELECHTGDRVYFHRSGEVVSGYVHAIHQNSIAEDKTRWVVTMYSSTCYDNGYGEKEPWHLISDNHLFGINWWVDESKAQAALAAKEG